MKLYILFFFSFLFLFACNESSYKNTTTNTQQPSDTTETQASKQDTMNDNNIQLAVGGSKDLFLPNRGTSGLQLLYEVTGDVDAISIQRKPLGEEHLAQLDLQVGESYPARFEVTAVAKGSGQIVFSERRVGMPDSSYLLVKQFEFEVME